MLRISLERLFDGWRRRGDAAALAKVFDRTAPELWKLAIHLVRDPAEAEDVLQATYLVAIERADSYDRARPLVPWLVGILVNQARMARKKKRTADERRVLELEPPGDGEDPRELAAAEEFSTALVKALESLPEPYRKVLRMHLSEGRRPVEIARELGRPPGTVRMQMHRGLAMLRRALPAGFAAGAALSAFPTRGMPALRAEVLARAETIAPAAAASSGAAMLFSGAALKVAVLGIAAGAVGLWALRSEEAAESQGAVGTAGMSSATAADRRSSPELIESTERSAVETVPVAAAASAEVPREHTWLRGRVVGPAPEDRGEVRLEVRGAARFVWPEGVVARGVAADDGSFEIDVTPLMRAAEGRLPLHGLVVVADHPRYLPAEADIALAPGRREYEAEIELSPAGVIRGRLRLPARDLEVRVAALQLVDGVPALPPVNETICSPDGSFALRVRGRGEHAVVALADGLRPLTLRATVAPGAVREFVTAPLATGAVLEGTVLVARETAPGARVAAVSSRAGLELMVLGQSLLFGDGRFERRVMKARAGEDGRFRFDGLAPGAHAVELLGFDEHVSVLGGIECGVDVLAPAAGIVLELDLAQVAFRVQDARGAPLGGRVLLEQGRLATWLDLDAEGACGLAVRPLLPCQIRIESDLHRPAELTLYAPNAGGAHVERVAMVPEPARSTLELAFNAPEGTRLNAIVVALRSLDEAGESTGTTFHRRLDVEAGTARLDLVAGSYEIDVFVGSHYEHHHLFLLPLSRRVSLSPGVLRRETLTLGVGGRLRIAATAPEGGFVPATCAVRDASGTELAVRFLAWRPERLRPHVGRLGGKGPNEVYPNLPVGDYLIELTSPGRSAEARRARVTAGAVTDIEVSLRLEGER